VTGGVIDSAGPGLGIREIAIDSAGAIYVGGQIAQAQVHFPKLGNFAATTPLTTTAGAFQTGRKNNFTAYVVKVHPDGSKLDYATYLGGSVGEFVTGIAVDSTGVAYLGGGTSSADFPVTPGAFQPTNPGTSAFFAKLKPDGSGLLYSTILGATGIDTEGDALTIDSSNNAYLSGVTSGPGFPTTPGVFNPTVTTTADRNFVSKFDPAGNLAMSTYIGEAEFVVGIKVDSTGIYASGVTFSPNYPLLNSMQPAGSPFAAFVTKLDPTGSSLIYSTLAFGSPQGMSIVGQQNVYLGGVAGPSTPATIGAFQTTSAAFNPFFTTGYAAKIVPSLGTAVPTIEPRGIAFPDILQQGVASAPLTSLVTNWGDVDVGLGSIAISGANPGDFSQTNNCSATLAAANNCTITVVFTPTVGEGVRTATITVTFGGNFPAQTISLTGKAGTPRFQLNPVPVDFGTIGDSGVANQSFRMINVGTAPLVPISATINPPPAIGNPFLFGAAPFLETLQPGETSIPFDIEMVIPFLAPGPQSGQLIIQDNTPNSPHVFNLTGFGFHVGQDFALATARGVPASATVTAGQTASYDVLIASVRIFSAETIAFTCSGAPAGATCSTSPTSMAADFQTQHISISVKTTGASASLQRNAPAWPWAAMAVAAVVCMRPRRRKLIAHMVMVCAVGVLGSMLACGGGSGSLGNGGGPPTPPGTYSLTLTATSTPTLPGSPPSVTHTLPLTLVVK